MKIRYVMLLVWSITLHAMEKPTSKPTIGYNAKPLTELALESKLQKLKNKAELNVLLAQIPQDQRCNAVKKVIRSSYLTQEDVLALIKVHCDDNILMRAYTYFIRTSPENKNLNRAKLKSLAAYATTLQSPAVPFIAELVDYLEGKIELKYTLITLFITDGLSEYIPLLVEMGEQPKAIDLSYAIQERHPGAIQQLLNARVPLFDQSQPVIYQPLYRAFFAFNEPLIQFLLANGASLTQPYPSGVKVEGITIADQLKKLIIEQNPEVFPNATPEQLTKYYQRFTKLVNKYVTPS